MKTTTLLIFASIFLISTNAAVAKVGDSEAQVDHRYGKIAGKWDDYIGYKKLYHWHGFDVLVTFVDGVSQREMFNKADGIQDPHDRKFLARISGADHNGITMEDSGTFTTKEFSEKYAAARAAAWAKSEQSDKR